MNEAEPLALHPSPETALSTPPQPTFRRFLFGDDGLRAGWSLLLFLLLLALLGPTANFVIKHFHLLPKPVPGAIRVMTARSTIIPEGLNFGLIALAALVMSRIERRPFSRYGLAPHRMFADFAAGLVWGVSLLSLLVATLFLTHALAFDGLLLHGSAAFAAAAKWALAFLLVGLFEEFLTRGYIQYTVARGVAGLTRALDPINRHAHAIGFWVAAFLFSVCLFMAGHLFNKGETTSGILAVGVAGSVFAFSLYRTGSLWWAIGFHAAWDWAQSFLYGVADSGIPSQNHLLATHPMGPVLLSGGATGPEGSLFVLPTLMLAALVIHLTLPRRAYPLTADQSPVQIPQQPAPVAFSAAPLTSFPIAFAKWNPAIARLH